MAGGNFVKSQPILKILLPLERKGNFKQIYVLLLLPTITYCTHYLWEFKSSNLL